MYARRLIIRPNEVSHVFFRCHNQSYYLEPKVIKDTLIKLLAIYKQRYQIKIFEFNILDNHVHLLVRPHSAEALGHFMRTVNSQLARAINKHFTKDSQAIRDRYKSPMVTSAKYLKSVMQYIWLNRYKVNKRCNIENDPYCSVSWRLNPPYQEVANPHSEDEIIGNKLANLLDSYAELGLTPLLRDKSEADLIRQWIDEAIYHLDSFITGVFENIHTIGDQVVVKFRTEMLSAFRRLTGPPWTPV